MRPASYREASLETRADLERIPDFTMGMDFLKFLHLYIVPAQGKVYVTAAHEELSPRTSIAGDRHAQALHSRLHHLIDFEHRRRGAVRSAAVNRG